MRKSTSRLAMIVILIATVTIVFYCDVKPDSHLVIGGALTGSKVFGKHFPKTITDPVGQSYTLKIPAKRIVSATLAGDEMLQQLKATDNVISVTHLADDDVFSNVVDHFPESIYRNHAEVEEILSLTPDLVIVAPYTNAITVRLLLANHIPVIRFPRHNSFQDIDDNIHLLAEVLDKKEQADTTINNMWRRIRNIECLVQNQPKPRVLYFTLNGATAGKGTLTDEMIHYAGGYNVVHETNITGFSRLTNEYAVSLHPDVLFLTDWFAKTKQDALHKLSKNPLWKDVPAVANERIFIIKTKTSGTVTPFRVKGIEELAAVLHPDLYASHNVMRCEHSDLQPQTARTTNQNSTS